MLDLRQRVATGAIAVKVRQGVLLVHVRDSPCLLHLRQVRSLLKPLKAMRRIGQVRGQNGKV